MEILLSKVLVFGLVMLAIKLYWDNRDLKNRLYISEHVFFKDAIPDEPASRPPKSAKKAGAKA